MRFFGSSSTPYKIPHILFGVAEGFFVAFPLSSRDPLTCPQAGQELISRRSCIVGQCFYQIKKCSIHHKKDVWQISFAPLAKEKLSLLASSALIAEVAKT